jgi:FHA domain-containing protein
MTLTLRVVSLNDLPLTQPITAQFDAQGGTIGRADHNTMALPDPERHISRQQAEIRPGAGGYVIRNIGSANPITVRGQPLAQGQSLPLNHRDQVRIGGYLLEVVDDAADEAGATVVRRSAAEPLVRPPVPDPTEPRVRVSAAGANPFAGLIDPPAAPLPQGSAPARLPDDFDPFAPPPPPRPPAPPQSFEALGTGAFADLVPNEHNRSIDDMFGLQPGARDPLADFMAGAPPASGSAPAVKGLPADPMALFGDAASQAQPEPVTPALPDHTPALQSAFRPPEVQVPPRAAAAPMAPQPQPAPALAPPAAALPAAPGDIEALWRAFCEGAGVRLQLPQGLNPELMRVMGQLMRTALDGTLQLMAVRAATKHELRAQVTVIQSRNNNPLKFSPDAQSALEQLLQPPVRGFLPGPAAMADAMDDLVGHAIGTMAGTRAALEGVLTRFRPQALESKLTGRSMLDSVLPLNRKAKLWELYLQHFDAIREEAQEDFHNLFGKAFLAAYEEQLQRLQERKSAA